MKPLFRSVRLCALLVSLSFVPACGQVSTVVAPSVPSEAPTLSRVSAHVGQAIADNEKNVDGPAKESTRANLQVAQAGLPAPDAADAKAARQLSELFFANQTLAGLALMQEQSTALRVLREKMQAERAAAVAKLEAEIQRIRSEAEEKTRRLVAFIFFGGSALCLAAGVLALTVLRGVPMIGPKLVGGCFVLAAVLSGMGVVILKAMQNPWLIYTGGIIAGAVLVGVLVMAYVNHWHAKASTP